RSRGVVPEVPAVPRIGPQGAAHAGVADRVEAVRTTFGLRGPLARALPDFEPRAGQVEMASAVAKVFERGGVLLAEAGTGTGKTRTGMVAETVFLPIIRRWSTETETGDRAELTDLPEDLPFWSDVAATAETCLGTECPRYDECFVTKMRQRAAASDVVIVNHHLLCADAAVRQNAYGEVIPACSRAIVDEAHQLEDVATQYFGYSVSNYRFEELARDIERSLFIIVGNDRKAKEEVAKTVERLRDYARAFFSDVAFAHRATGSIRSEERVRATTESLVETQESAADLTSALDR